LPAVEEVAGAVEDVLVEDVLLRLDPPHALRTSAAIVALTARNRRADAPPEGGGVRVKG
jgi:hypothetical protein